MSTTLHKATPEQWENAEYYADPDRKPRPLGEYACLLELRARVEALEAGATCPHVRTSNEGTSYCALAEQASAPASADVRPTVKARITRDRDETGDYLIIHDASPPASSLVERVAKGIGSASPWMHSHRDEARAAIREVATWLKQEGIEAWAADRLLEEVNRA